ncbi:MAG TPA: DUF2332 domain-containing protein [Acidimicrobiales bacterium]|nr:DUF2332 domain-containing protein [Acidimicrobiales bacterium]
MPFYTALLHELERDTLALELLASVRLEQRNPMLILAALQLAGLRGHPVLGPIYDRARLGHIEDMEAAALSVLGVVHDTPELVRSELWRSTQTNEPGRSAILQVLVAELVGQTFEEVNLIEVGTSAGINLCFDQFPVRTKDDGNALTLICDDLTSIDRTRKMPSVKSRVGIDPHPLDLSNEEDRLWLKACLWPEERRRHERLDAIVAARPSWPSVTELTGTALERLDDAFDEGDANAMTIVVNTWVAFYFTPDEQLAYFNEMSRRCREGNVAWISMESAMVTWPGVSVDDEAHHRGASQIVMANPGSAPAHWGWCHAHGRWLEQTTFS